MFELNWPAKASLMALVTMTVAAGLGTPADAKAVTRPTAIVAIGDSYISGEGGRWAGNSASSEGSRHGTDRAYLEGLTYDPARVYGPTFDSGCDRSDVAEIVSNEIAVDRKINLACSGAKAENIIRSVSGGKRLKGEAPQAEQLAAVAGQNDIKMIVLSVGGNDWGFGDLVTRCVARFAGSSTTDPWRCQPDSDPELQRDLGGAMQAVRHTVEEVRGVMSDAGYAAADYRLVIQSAPSVIPRGTQIRYPEEGLERVVTGGCPIWNSDATWVRDRVVPLFASSLRAVAIETGSDFLDLQDAFQGHEVCSTESRQADARHVPTESTSEWARFLSLGVSQGTMQESFHANYYGQQAIATCLDLMYAGGSGSYRCVNTPRRGVRDMKVSRI